MGCQLLLAGLPEGRPGQGGMDFGATAVLLCAPVSSVIRLIKASAYL